jgi:hypothetical protein
MPAQLRELHAAIVQRWQVDLRRRRAGANGLPARHSGA